MDFEQLKQQVIQLSQLGDNLGAARLLQQHQHEFQEQASMMYLWQIEAFSLARHTDEAIGVLRTALTAGHWYPSDLLRANEDLGVLRDLPEFQNLLAACDQLQRDAQKNVTRQHRIVEDEQTPGNHLFIALHGNLSNVESHAEPWSRVVKQGCTLLMPQSTQIVAPDRYVWNHRDWAVEDVLAAVDASHHELKEVPEDIILGGFSAGADLSLWLGLTGQFGSKLRGLLIVAPALVDPLELRQALEAQQPPSIPVYIVVGQQDGLGWPRTAELKTVFQDYDIDFEVEEHPNLGHAYPSDFDASLHRGLKFILKI